MKQGSQIHLMMVYVHLAEQDNRAALSGIRW